MGGSLNGHNAEITLGLYPEENRNQTRLKTEHEHEHEHHHEHEDGNESR